MSAEAPGRRRWRRRRPEPRMASDLVRRYGTGAGRVVKSGPPAGVAALREPWVATVGEMAARHSDPVRRSRAGVVSVACSSSVWAQELMARRDELLERLRAESGDTAITGLRFAVADHAVRDLATPVEPVRPPRPAPAPTAADRTAGEHAAQGIDDPELRALVARAAAAAAARRRI